MNRRIAIFVAQFQAVLIVVHLFLCLTWIYFAAPPAALTTSHSSASNSNHWPLLLTFFILSISFLATSLIGFRTTNVLLRIFYRISAVWLGFVNYAFFSAVLCWILYFALRLAAIPINRQDLAYFFLGLAVAITAYGVVNAASTRVKRITIKIPNLPPQWRGRTAVLASDVHLGNYRSLGFIRRVVGMIQRHNPDVVFIAGDLYDGTPADYSRLAEPLRTLQPPFGAYFVEGNHEEFTSSAKFARAVGATGVRVLDNERVEIDGLQIVGVNYRDATHGEHFRKILRYTSFDRSRPSILLTHAPDRVGISAEEGISLQLSGHTHLGQFWPWTRLAGRMYGTFVYGLNRAGEMQIYTSTGAGTWGPPLRVGSTPEIVVIRFE